MSALAALLLDFFFGEPPASCHPVVWIGHYLRWTGKHILSFRPAAALLAGFLLWTLGASVVVGCAALIEQWLRGLPFWLECLAIGILLKPLLSFRLLLEEVSGVESALACSLDDGRQRLSRIVSRDTTNLSASEVRESALESLSENLSDSLVAPLLWFALLGLPGAALYRYANTADAMWGYHGKWEWAGKWAAWFDDVGNIVAARLTALVLILTGRNSRAMLSRLSPEARRTPSPNSGWPMAALALVHGIRLGKPGVYVLNPSGSAPTTETTTACLRHVRLAGWLLALGLAGCSAFFRIFIYG